MKKRLLSSLFLAVAFGASSQPIITQSDLPVANTHIVVVYDTLPSVLPGSAGASQTWDFTTLGSNGVDTTYFVDPAGTLYASSFPTANLANYNASSDSDVGYFSSSASAFTVLGFGVPNPPLGSGTIVIKQIPGQDLVQFPGTYNQNFSGDSHFVIQFPDSLYNSDSIRLIHYTHYESEMDAWGSLTTPYGNYNTLRQKFTEHTIDSIFIHFPLFGWNYVSSAIDSSLMYKWLTNSVGLPVVQMNMDASFSAPVQVTYVKYTSLGIGSPLLSSASVFPNPASDFVTLKSEAGTIAYAEVTNVLGETVKTQNVSASTVTISVAELPAGMYSILLRNKQGKIESVSRVSVEH